MARRRRRRAHPSGCGRVLNQPTATAGQVSVAGKVLDTSSLAVWTEGRISVQAWITVARAQGLTLLVPELARAEILALRPDTTSLVDELAGHPHVLVVPLTSADREAIEEHLRDTDTCDVLASWVIHLCRQRGWSALTADPGRLRRLAPDLETDQL